MTKYDIYIAIYICVVLISIIIIIAINIKNESKILINYVCRNEGDINDDILYKLIKLGENFGDYKIFIINKGNIKIKTDSDKVIIIDSKMDEIELCRIMRTMKYNNYNKIYIIGATIPKIITYN